MTPASKWKWYGYSGHFICGRWCRFHLCTKVGKYLVSTVGMYVHPSKSQGGEKAEFEYLNKNPNGDQIGCDRFYETMVFLAGERCREKGCNCGQPVISGSELDFLGYQEAGEAAKGHYKMCLKFAGK